MGGPTHTAVGADLIDAGAAVLAGPRVLATFIHVLPAGGAVEAGWAATDVRGLEGQTLATIGTGIGSAWISLLAHLPWWVSGMKGSCRLPWALQPGPPAKHQGGDSLEWTHHLFNPQDPTIGHSHLSAGKGLQF